MSRFKGILDQAKHRERATADAPTPPPASGGSAATATAPPSPAPVASPPALRKPGRPPGKRSDPGYVQVTAYISEDIHHNVKLALLQERKGREFSELVGELLAGWLKSHG